MKILFFNGGFTWDENSQFDHNGLICLCHVEQGDMIKTNTVSNLIYSESQNNKYIVIVPFPYLDTVENKMPCEPAKQLLEKIALSIRGRDVIVSPTSKGNVFNLSIPQAVFGKPDQRMKYLEI